MKGVELHISGTRRATIVRNRYRRDFARGSMAGRGSQNVMDEPVGRLLVVSKLIYCFISLVYNRLSFIQDWNFKLIDWIDQLFREIWWNWRPPQPRRGTESC